MVPEEPEIQSRRSEWQWDLTAEQILRYVLRTRWSDWQQDRKYKRATKGKGDSVEKGVSCRAGVVVSAGTHRMFVKSAPIQRVYKAGRGRWW